MFLCSAMRCLFAAAGRSWPPAGRLSSPVATRLMASSKAKGAKSLVEDVPRKKSRPVQDKSTRVAAGEGVVREGVPKNVATALAQKAERKKKKSEEIAAVASGPADTSARAKKYMQDYYARNREKMLEKNEANRKSKKSLARVGIYTTGKRGRPVKKRPDVDHDDDHTLSPEELQREIARHEKIHEEWMKEVEKDRAELLRMYEDEEDVPVPGLPSVDDDETAGPLTVQDVVRVLRTHQAVDVATLDLRHKTDLCDYKVIVTGTSAAHMRALSDAVFLAFKKRKEFHTMPRLEGRTNTEWVLLDCGFLMVHIFEEATRRKYNLEALWGLRPSAEELAITQDYDWEDGLFPEFSQAVYDALPEE